MGSSNLGEIQGAVVEIQRNLYLQNLENQKLPGNCSQENQTALPPPYTPSLTVPPLLPPHTLSHCLAWNSRIFYIYCGSLVAKEPQIPPHQTPPNNPTNLPT
jgi:hypothetical protein